MTLPTSFSARQSSKRPSELFRVRPLEKAKRFSVGKTTTASKSFAHPNWLGFFAMVTILTQIHIQLHNTHVHTYPLSSSIIRSLPRPTCSNQLATMTHLH